MTYLRLNGKASDMCSLLENTRSIKDYVTACSKSGAVYEQKDFYFTEQKLQTNPGKMKALKTKFHLV